VGVDEPRRSDSHRRLGAVRVLVATDQCSLAPGVVASALAEFAPRCTRATIVVIAVVPPWISHFAALTSSVALEHLDTSALPAAGELARLTAAAVPGHVSIDYWAADRWSGVLRVAETYDEFVVVGTPARRRDRKALERTRARVC
jgi:hypothetical protein